MESIIKVEESKIQITKNLYEILKQTVSKDESRFYMNHVYRDPDDNVIVGTDGRRLFLLDTTDIDLSANSCKHFDPVKIGKEFFLVNTTMDGTYPNYKRVIPEYEGGEYCKIVSQNNYIFNFSGRIHDDSISLFWLLKGVNAPINLDYILKTLKFADPFEVYTDGSGRKAVVMTWQDCIYVVMPMQID